MKNITWVKTSPFISIVITALAITVIVGTCTYYVMRLYQTLMPIWVEQAGYSQWPMLRFWALMHEDGFWHAVFLIKGEKHLLQLIVLGIFAPQLLTWFHSPLVMALPTLAVFLILFGWSVYKRIGQLGYSIASMLLYCSIAQMTFHAYGLGSGFADWQSMFLLSAAALSLIHALMQPGIFWIRWFSILVSLAVLARTTSVFYAVVICAPMVALYLIEQFKREGSVKQVGITIVNIFVIIFPVAMIVLGQLAVMLRYYGPTNAWQLHQSYSVAVENIFQLLVSFMGVPLILICIVLFLFQVYKGYSGGYKFSSPEIAVVWWIVGYLGFLIAYGYTSTVPKEVMYVVPGLFLFFLAPVWVRNDNTSLYNFLTVGISIISIGLFAWNFYHNIERAHLTTPERDAVREVQYEMARIISSLPSSTIWQSYASVDWGIPVTLITQYEFGEYRQYGGDHFFYNKQAYWETWYPDMSVDELQLDLYDRTVNCIDAVVVLRDTETLPDGMEEYSFSIAAYIADRVKNDPKWEYFRALDGWSVGTNYLIYLNQTPRLNRICQDIRK